MGIYIMGEKASCSSKSCRERKFFIHNLLVQIHLIIEIFAVDRPCAMVVCMTFSR